MAKAAEKKVGGLRITISGPMRCGKSRFLNRVLIPALRIAEIPSSVDDDGDGAGPGTYGEGEPQVEILVTNDDEKAAAHARGERRST